MSSNMQILKTCDYCKGEFIAKKTSSKTCSDHCAKRLYKLNQREKKIQQAVIKEEVKKKPSAFVDEREVKAIQAKDNLTLKEAALLINISPLTLRRWVFAGKLASVKVGKKHLFQKRSIIDFISV